jgi:hypothetical protein
MLLKMSCKLKLRRSGKVACKKEGKNLAAFKRAQAVYPIRIKNWILSKFMPVNSHGELFKRRRA